MNNIKQNSYYWCHVLSLLLQEIYAYWSEMARTLIRKCFKKFLLPPSPQQLCRKISTGVLDPGHNPTNSKIDIVPPISWGLCMRTLIIIIIYFQFSIKTSTLQTQISLSHASNIGSILLDTIQPLFNNFFLPQLFINILFNI